jgi:hypothetical protein
MSETSDSGGHGDLEEQPVTPSAQDGLRRHAQDPAEGADASDQTTSPAGTQGAHAEEPTEG